MNEDVRKQVNTFRGLAEEFRKRPDQSPSPYLFTAGRVLAETTCRAALQHQGFTLPEGIPSAAQLAKAAIKADLIGARSAQEICINVLIMWGNHFSHDQEDRLEPPPSFAEAFIYAAEAIIVWYKQIDGCECLKAAGDRVVGPWLIFSEAAELHLVSAADGVLTSRPFGRASGGTTRDLGTAIHSLVSDPKGKQYWALTESELIRFHPVHLRELDRVEFGAATTELLAAQVTSSRLELLFSTVDGAMCFTFGYTGPLPHTPGPPALSAAASPTGGFIELREGGAIAGEIQA